MTYNHNEKVGKKLIAKARQTDLVHYLRAKHPDSVQYASHPDAPGKFCWRGTKYDSITFFISEIGGIEVYKYFRWSNKESDDGIAYLVKYEGYSFPNAVKALAYFTDPYDEEEDAPDSSVCTGEDDDIHPAVSYCGSMSDRHYKPNAYDQDHYPEYLSDDPLYIPDGIDDDEGY